MNARIDQYWACTVCDSGGHPLTATQAYDGAQTHMERSGHLTVLGTIKQEDE